LILPATVFSALSLLAPPPTLIAAGDIATCRARDDEATAALVARIPGTVAVLGDAVYDFGTADEFRYCYSWARFRGRTRAALGNHEYATGSAADAIAYFGLPRAGYYSYRLGTWHVIVLNSNCRPAGGCEEGSPQQRWLEAELARVRARCTLAYMHHPRFASGLHGSDETVAPLWRTMARAGVDVALAGHDHHYERFARWNGIRSFVVGTGGAGLRPVFRRIQRPRSVAMTFLTHGVLRLSLRPGRYDWRFVPVQPSSFRDAGSGRCR
jgi:hypothetical protein